MTETERQLLTNIIDALELFWLENLAMHNLLDQYCPPDWFEWVYEQSQSEANKAVAHERFALVRALIQQAQSESEVLAVLIPLLSGQGKPN
jgi:hypothetical protein